MTYATHKAMTAWFRNSRRNPLDPADHEISHHRREGRERKQAVMEAVSAHSNLRGPFGCETISKWFRDCAHARRMIVYYRKEIAAHSNDPKFDLLHAAQQIEEFKQRHRRTIECIRGIRFDEVSLWSPLCPYPFYVEPNTNFVPHDDVAKAEAHGVVFHRVQDTMTLQMFMRLQKRFATAGRMAAFWSCWNNLDNLDDSHKVPIRCEFLFSDPTDMEKLVEEMVWLKLRF